jgi:hypothetical protein
LNRGTVEQGNSGKGFINLLFFKIMETLKWYKDLHVWKVGMEIVIEIYYSTKNFPKRNLWINSSD